jgi:hypothetical protein
MAGPSRDVLTGTVLTQCLQGSAQCFAGANRDVLTGKVLTQCLQGSAQCFAGASRDGLAGMYCKGYSNRDGFDTVFAGFCESSKIK